MRSFNATALNVLYTEVKGKVSPIAEVILITSEIEYSCPSGLGAMNKMLVPSTLRFSADAASLREIAKAFKEYAALLDAAAKVFPNA